MAISVLLADDHEVVRRGVRALLESEAGFIVVGEIADGREVAGDRGREAVSQYAALAVAAAGLYRPRVQAATDPYETLSVREREVFDLAAHGVTNSEIGRRLAISRRTAESHRSNLMRKLALKGEKDLLRYAVRRGILSLDSGV
jgi:DNA-binding NarL/FixJ family response regulator